MFIFIGAGRGFCGKRILPTPTPSPVVYVGEKENRSALQWLPAFRRGEKTPRPMYKRETMFNWSG